MGMKDLSDTPDDDTVKVCPECGDSSIVHTSQSNHGGTHGTERYRCTSNNHVFEEPKTRERQGNTEPGHKGAAKSLSDADPDAWP
jgi:transposase-like protein